MVIVLGYIGFQEYFASTGQERSFGDTLYVTMQLFVLESGALPDQVNWYLQIARFLAPLMTLFTALQVAAGIFREQIQMMRMRFLKDHIIICGLGRKGYLLSRSFSKLGKTVVIIEQDTENDLLVQCREEGIMVLLGNATDLALLRQAGAGRAGYVISVCGDDATNAEIATLTHGLVTKRKNKALSCLVHIYDLQLFNLVREREMSTGEPDAFRLELFNIFESGSRVLLQEFPPLGAGDSISEVSPRIAVVGIGRLGESVVINAAREWWKQAKNKDRLYITLVDRQAKMKIQLLKERYPHLAKACVLTPIQIDIKGPDFERADFLSNGQGINNLTAVYVCLDDESSALSAALTLRRKLFSHEIPVVVRTAHESGLASLLRKSNLSYDSFASLQPFDLLDRTCTPELISGCTHEIIARAFHKNYVENELKKGITPEINPSMVPWEDLPESLKESNRDSIEHIRLKLQAIGCDIAVTNEWDVPPFRFSPDEVELMARMEHERFVSERKKQGFTSSSTKDTSKKKSPVLVPWEDLPEAEKDKDRELVRKLSQVLAQARFQIYRFKVKPTER